MGAAGLGGDGDFLARFKAYGWYLDDLVLTPVYPLDRPERRCRCRCRAAQRSLTDRISKYQPRAIVSLLLSIEDIVEAAAIAAGNNAPRFAVPFPGNGQQARFRRAMALVLPRLPREELATAV